MQLSFYSLFPALFFGVLYKDGQVVREDGFFVGYNLLVWITILLQVLGGLTVAMCVAQMDNIIKNFAVSISIVFSFLIEVYFFETSITINVSFYEPSAVTLLTFIVCIRRLYCNISDLSIWQTNVFISIMRCEKYLQMLLLLPRWGRRLWFSPCSSLRNKYKRVENEVHIITVPGGCLHAITPS